MAVWRPSGAMRPTPPRQSGTLQGAGAVASTHVRARTIRHRRTSRCRDRAGTRQALSWCLDPPQCGLRLLNPCSGSGAASPPRHPRRRRLSASYSVSSRRRSTTANRLPPRGFAGRCGRGTSGRADHQRAPAIRAAPLLARAAFPTSRSLDGSSSNSTLPPAGGGREMQPTAFATDNAPTSSAGPPLEIKRPGRPATASRSEPR